MSDLLRKTSGILDNSQQAIQNATQATANLQSISAKIDWGQGSAGALVNDKQLYNNLAQTTSTMRDTMVRAQTGVTDFQENMEALKHNSSCAGISRTVATKIPPSWQEMRSNGCRKAHR
jgi:phage shock protein A